MRSLVDALRAIALCAAVAATAAPAHALTAEEVRQAASQTAKDPNLGGTHKEKVLRLRPDKPEEKKRETPSTWKWLADLIRWIAETGRVLVWLGGAAAIGLLLVGLRHWLKVRGEALAPQQPAAPTHVRGLDIRTASLPPMIGEAAAGLWRAGAHRDALSLLYRGALSRLVHRHSVPVRGSSTEAECVQLAHERVDAERVAFFAGLVAVWQTAVYGARMPAGESVAELCRAFDTLWPAEQGTGA